MTSIEKKARRKKALDSVLIFMPNGFAIMLLVNYVEYVLKGRIYKKHMVQMLLLTFLLELLIVLSDVYFGPGDMLLSEYFGQMGLPWLWLVNDMLVSIPCSYVFYRFHSRFMKRRFYWWLDSM